MLLKGYFNPISKLQKGLTHKGKWPLREHQGQNSVYSGARGQEPWQTHSFLLQHVLTFSMHFDLLFDQEGGRGKKIQLLPSVSNFVNNPCFLG